MSPFLDEEENDDDYDQIDEQKLDEHRTLRTLFLQDDKKFFLIGGSAAVVAFGVIAYVLYSNTRQIPLDELPVIKADATPLKMKPQHNEQISHQDKVVYDNISGSTRASTVEKIIPPNEEVLSINEMDSSEHLSEAEKKNIIQAFDDLTPEKEYKINYIKSSVPKTVDQSHLIKSNGIKIVEKELPPIKKIDGDDSRKKQKISSMTESKVEGKPLQTPGVYGDNIMVQVASVGTKTSAEAEYKRISNRNKFLKNFGRKIIRVDLGKKGIRYRILIGPFKKYGDAGKVISQLKNSGFSGYISR
jgi:hypothetical protein